MLLARRIGLEDNRKYSLLDMGKSITPCDMQFYKGLHSSHRPMGAHWVYQQEWVYLESSCRLCTLLRKRQNMFQKMLSFKGDLFINYWKFIFSQFTIQEVQTCVDAFDYFINDFTAE